MKRLLAFSGLSVLFSLLHPLPLLAVDFCPAGQFDNLCKLSLDKNANIFSNVIEIMLVLAAIASLFFLIYGGIRWIMSGGDKAKIGEARAMLTAAIVGLIISFLAFFILNLVAGLFGLDSHTLFTIPRLVNN